MQCFVCVFFFPLFLAGFVLFIHAEAAVKKTQFLPITWAERISMMKMYGLGQGDEDGVVVKSRSRGTRRQGAAWKVGHGQPSEVPRCS